MRNRFLLVHDDTFGQPLIDALARFGKGLPANVIPFSVHSPTVFGHAEILSATAAGFGDVVFLVDPQKADELSGLEQEKDLSLAVLAGFGSAGGVVITTDPDPDQLEALLYGLETPGSSRGDFYSNRRQTHNCPYGDWQNCRTLRYQ